jgi:hypothetical protein
VSLQGASGHREFLRDFKIVGSGSKNLQDCRAGHAVVFDTTSYKLQIALLYTEIIKVPRRTRFATE